MKQHNTSMTSLYPLLAIGILVILLLLVIKQYMLTADSTATIILPAGATYLGK